jgi:hypothetical protein
VNRSLRRGAREPVSLVTDFDGYLRQGGSIFTFLGFLHSTPDGRQWKGVGICRGIARGYGWGASLARQKTTLSAVSKSTC